MKDIESLVVAARDSMPPDTTHVVEIRVSNDHRRAYVLLAAEVAGAGFYLDESTCERDDIGTWWADACAGGGFTDRSLEDLRRDPPQPGLSDAWGMRRIA